MPIVETALYSEARITIINETISQDDQYKLISIRRFLYCYGILLHFGLDHVTT